MPTAVQQRRVDRLRQSYRVVFAAYEDAKRWNNAEKIAGFATALKLLDACECIEEGAPPFADAEDLPALYRLYDIARERDLLAADREPVEANGDEATA